MVDNDENHHKISIWADSGYNMINQTDSNRIQNQFY